MGVSLAGIEGVEQIVEPEIPNVFGEVQSPEAFPQRFLVVFGTPEQGVEFLAEPVFQSEVVAAQHAGAYDSPIHLKLKFYKPGLALPFSEKHVVVLLSGYEVGLQVTCLYLFYFSHLLFAENYAFPLAEGVGEPGLVEFYVRELTHFCILRG